MRGLHNLVLILSIIGAINWGLIGFFNFNLVAAIFGDATGLTRLVYSLVGLAGLVLAYTGFRAHTDERLGHGHMTHARAA